MMSHILTENGLSIVIDGLPRLIPKGHPKWDQIVAVLDDRAALERILNPTARFRAGDRWTTRAGQPAVITHVDPMTGLVSFEVDECYEIDTYAGVVAEGAELDDDLIEKEHSDA